MQYQAAKDLMIMQLKNLQSLVQQSTDKKLTTTDNSNFKIISIRKSHYFSMR